MKIENNLHKDPFFSICIPQYNRTSFIIEACRSLVNQTFRDFEICISDDNSTDGREGEIIDFLRSAGASFIYYKQANNKRYDANLRQSIELARGKYCFLLGNDDCLNANDSLELLHKDIGAIPSADVVLTNYKKFAGGMEFRRIRKTGIIGCGPEAAASNFRKFSFLSGVILNTKKAKDLATDRWDGSEMYQTFIACSMMAGGANLAGIDRCSVLQGIKIPGESVDSYASKEKLARCRIEERRIPLNIYGRVVADSIEPHTSPGLRRKFNKYIILQTILFTYPYWVFEYRRCQSWRYAAGICLGMRPKNILEGISLGIWQRVEIGLAYFFVSLASLLIPLDMFKRFYPDLYKAGKKYFG